MTTFESLHLSKPILDTLKKCGYTKPTPIQAKAIPVAKSGKDIIAKAPTGTGKTAAFVLPSLEKILQAKNRTKPKILILTPTRELATQTNSVIQKYGKDIQARSVCILGGMPYREQLQKLSRPHDILMATPGRLIDYMKRGNLDFSQIEMLVLDEADRMLDMGFIEDVEYIAKAIPNKRRQTLLFTATMDQKLIKLAANILKDPVSIEISEDKITFDNITQRIHLADDLHHKTKLLQHVLTQENVFKAIIFSGTKRNADELAQQLRKLGHSASALHGDMNQRKRNKAILLFRDGTTQFLIATDVAARGIDIHDITHVINYDLPRFAEDYVHRIGRTGRAGKKGTAISLALANEYGALKKIERFTKQNLALSTIPGLEPKKKMSSDQKPSNKKSRGKFSHKSSSGKSSYKKPERKFSDRSDRFGDKPTYKKSDRKSSDRSDRFGDKPAYKKSERRSSDRSDRFGDKPAYKTSERRSSDRSDRFGDKPAYKTSDRKSSDRSDRFGDKPAYKTSDRKSSDRSDRFGDKPAYKKSEKKFSGNRSGASTSSSKPWQKKSGASKGRRDYSER